VPGIVAAVPCRIDLIGGPYSETPNEVVKVFRPTSALRGVSATRALHRSRQTHKRVEGTSQPRLADIAMRRHTCCGRFCDRSQPLSPQLVDSTAVDSWARALRPEVAW